MGIIKFNKIGPRMCPQGPGSWIRPVTCILKLSEVVINSAIS